jgi:hypothetical protein
MLGVGVCRCSVKSTNMAILRVQHMVLFGNYFCILESPTKCSDTYLKERKKGSLCAGFNFEDTMKPNQSEITMQTLWHRM